MLPHPPDLRLETVKVLRVGLVAHPGHKSNDPVCPGRKPEVYHAGMQVGSAKSASVSGSGHGHTPLSPASESDSSESLQGLDRYDFGEYSEPVSSDYVDSN